MKLWKTADGQTLYFKKGVYRSKVGKEDPGLTSTGNDSTVFLWVLEGEKEPNNIQHI